jgi:UDP-N-acetylmuramyl pentapeptide phosphotransferase/UDP-N-acetylglucosamine-1-phosphate transferase
MDGMDGFAGGMAVVGFGTFALLGLTADQPLFAALSLVVSGAVGGFLVFNFPPARIFMGDTGSSALGLAAAGFSSWGAQLNVFPFWISILVFSPFIVDASVTLLRRSLRKEKIWQAHRTHYYQRLVQLGCGHRNTVLGEYVVILGCAATAIAVVGRGTACEVVAAVSWAIFYVVAGFSVSRWERRVASRAT